MKNKVYYILPIATFALGFFVADVRNASQNTGNNNILTVLSSDQQIQKGNKDILSSLILEDTLSKANAQEFSKEYKKEILAVLDDLPEQQLQKYLQQAFPDQSFESIQNKKVFAQKMLQELTSQNDDEKLSGRISVSFTPVDSNQSDNVTQTYKYQELFAHFDTYGNFPKDDQVFIRWLNRETGEILLFTPKRISRDNDLNWISLIPDRGWQEGTYDIKVYQMNDALTPIAQTSYTLFNILD